MNWHRLFGLMLTDFFTGSPFVVELEKDLSMKQQLLDVVILRKRPGRFVGQLPDGLDNLATHNLITFKSHQEALDDWALKELTGHYVNYRKHLSAAGQQLLPEAEFRLYAVCSRYPHNLANEVSWVELRPGVYESRRGTDRIRVVVARQLAEAEHNAPLHLFSAVPELLRFGQGRYQRRSEDTSTLLDRLFVGYETEGLAMPYTMEDFRRDYIKEVLNELTSDEIIKILPPEKLKELAQQLGKLSESASMESKSSRKGRRRPKA